MIWWILRYSNFSLLKTKAILKDKVLENIYMILENPDRIFLIFCHQWSLCFTEGEKKFHKSGSVPNSPKCLLLILYLYKTMSKIPLSK